MRNIDLDSLQIFKAVVDFGGITNAATQLNRVQSNITTRVKNLEQRLGVKLFQRQGGKLVLSADGRLLLDYAERLLQLSSEAEAALRRGTPKGTLRIGTLESTAAARLPPLLSAYHERYPDVQMELVTGTSDALISRVHRFDVEAAFVSEPFNGAELETQEAFVEELVLIAGKNAQVRNAKELQECTIIAFSTGCSYRRILEDWLVECEIAPRRVLELASYHAIVACVAAGSGIAIVPRSVLRVVHAESLVQVLPLPPRVAKARTHLIWRSGQRSVVLDALLEEVRRNRQPA
ncbi:LysR family transcriptional regulator [Pseudomonas sp. BN417]|uniref:LysR family transcriptional regulator n=1 Tax=Pseudomonas sp. BN417 TaxID=2567890 RepID=UPI0024549854|nr:LysR family transcriptional regulator [Pseudomonas sp. BN417]MDH4554122.1 LysR family transcriptional regulator [Pseudomonas sp. BN417]